MNLEFDPRARHELFQAEQFYEGESSGLGAELLDEIDAALDTLLEHPNIGIALPDGFRQLVIIRFPYSLIYKFIRLNLIE